MDLAREHGLSTQAVRNYEEDGILPASERSPGGHRRYQPVHAHALRAFLALVPAHGHRTATDVLRNLNSGNTDTALALIDGSHAQLAEDRRTLRAVTTAVAHLTAPEPSGPSLFIGPLAHRLGIRPATLRKWERANLVVPVRDRATGYRVYPPDAVRDAQLVRQLRRGGYLLRQIEPVVAQVRGAGGVAALEATLDGWGARLTARGLAMLTAAAALAGYVEATRSAAVSS